MYCVWGAVPSGLAQSITPVQQDAKTGQGTVKSMPKTAILASVLPFLLFFMFQAIRAEDTWQKVLTCSDEDILVYTKTAPDFPIKAARGKTVARASLSALVTLIADVDSYPEWMHNVAYAKVLVQFNETARLIYTVQQTPWPLADRDIVSYAQLRQNPDTGQILIETEARPDDYPIQKEYVRVPKMLSRWQLIPKEECLTEVVYDIYADPGGKIPAHIANTCVIDTPLYTLKGLRRMVEKPKYREASIDFITDR